VQGLRVISAGFLTTVQDSGRFGYAHLGVSAAGAADAFSLRLGNLLVGNPQRAAGLEMTLAGPELEFGCPCDIALAGAEMVASVDGVRIPNLTAIRIDPGQRLICGSSSDGLRTYLCVSGGIEVPQLFGSAATHLMTGLGGFHGRALLRGDVIPIGSSDSSRARPLMKLRTEFISRIAPHRVLRVTPGPQEESFSAEARRLFYESEYEVRSESDRMGLRLTGQKLPVGGYGSEILTEGVSLGAVQITPSGEPIILFVDHQTTGGYPKIANVISADMHSVGQLRPGDGVTFKAVSLSEARTLLAQQESLFQNNPLIPA
jgi:antagonist of KipI